MKTTSNIQGAQFERELRTAKHPVLVNFYTSRTGPGRSAARSLAILAGGLIGDLSLQELNLDEHPELAQHYNVTDIPTLILFDSGAPIARFSAATTPPELGTTIRGLLADYAPPRGFREHPGNHHADSLPPASPCLEDAASITKEADMTGMKIIGMIGGMSWESTIEYYRLINESVKAKLGGLHSAKCILFSVDFAEVEELQRLGRWADAAQILVNAAQMLEKAGADLVLVCTNTMHKLAGTIQAGIGIPLVHIADPTAEKARLAGIRRVGLLGTRFTMEEDFYRDRLRGRFGLEVIIPNPEDRQTVHRIIYEELCVGTIRPESKASIASVIRRLVEGGAEGIILGCTELGLLLDAEDSRVPLFDTTRLHALAAVEYAFKSSSAAVDSLVQATGDKQQRK